MYVGTYVYRCIDVYKYMYMYSHLGGSVEVADDADAQALA